MVRQQADYPLDYSQGPDRKVPSEGEGLANTAAAQPSRVAADAQRIDERAAQTARAYGEEAQAAAKRVRPFMEKSMKEQPMQTLAAAAAVAFLLGALWKR